MDMATISSAALPLLERRYSLMSPHQRSSASNLRHGPVFYGSERVRKWIEWMIDYLVHVRARVGELLEEGLDPETVEDSVGYDEFAGDQLPADKHGMPKRHRNTVQKIIEEAGER
jgi:hypothetical protein